MLDTIEIIHGSKVQHGSLNDRIYLMELDRNNVQPIIDTLDKMAVDHGYGKIFAKIPAPDVEKFLSAGYQKEAEIPGFFNSRIDGFFLGKYFSEEREEIADTCRKSVEKILKRKEHAQAPSSQDIAFSQVEICTHADAPEMSTIYRQIFQSYPFPITNPQYIQEMMDDNVIYLCIRKERNIAAIASMEIDRTHENVEMTDFATLPQLQGHGLAARLLYHMDTTSKRMGLKTAYTIARANSHSMNSVFRRNGYKYAGLLKNNTQISGSIESMTVWFKNLTL